MTQTEKIRLELPLVLPTVIDANDLCIDRLIKGLSGRGGIEKVHIKKADAVSHYSACTTILRSFQCRA